MANKKATNLRTRALSAIAIGIPFLALTWLGGWPFIGLMYLVAALCAYELHGLQRLSNYRPSLPSALIALSASFAGLVLPAAPTPWLVPLVTLALLLSLVIQLRRFSRVNEPASMADWAVSTMGGLYLGWTAGLMGGLRAQPNGLWWVGLAVLSTWLADSGAYFAGRQFGARKLAPAISPGKTIEGYAGGVAASLLCGVAFGALSPLGWLACLAGSALVGLLSPLGDLAESMFKRQANAKDSGTLIPGHGGVFDRVDSMLWSGALVYLVALLAPK